MIYQIVIREELSIEWLGWFGNFAISMDSGGRTVLTGNVQDQGQLFSELCKIRDLGLTLVCVNPLNTEKESV